MECRVLGSILDWATVLSLMHLNDVLFGAGKGMVKKERGRDFFHLPDRCLLHTIIRKTTPKIPSKSKCVKRLRIKAVFYIKKVKIKVQEIEVRERFHKALQLTYYLALA